MEWDDSKDEEKSEFKKRSENVINGYCDGLLREKGGKDNLWVYKWYNRTMMRSAWGEGAVEVKVGNS